MTRFILSLGLVLLVAGCRREPDLAVQVARTPAAPAQTGSAAAEAGAHAPAFLTVSGLVEETLGGGDYTYMRLKTADGEIWAAVTRAGVKEGDKVTVVNAARMDGFESKTLNRKFEKIVFGTLAEEGAAAAPAAAAKGAPAGPPAAASHASQTEADMRQQMAARHAAAAAGPADVGKIDVRKAEGAQGKTVAELFAQRSELKDKEVAVRGKVVKFTPGVMGKNWIHLRDGSGSRQKKDDDVTVTTGDAAAIGDTILVKGTVRLDKDFGAGYTYTVLIEDAKVSKQDR